MLGVNRLFDAFDEAEHVAHAQDARNDTIGQKRLERVVFFADADELYGCAGYFANRKRGAATGIAVHFGEDYAGDAETLVEFSGGADSVLADHRVGDEEQLRRIQFALQLGKLFHQFVVNVQTAGGVHEDYIARGHFCFAESAADNFERLVGAGAGPQGGMGGFRDLGELFAGGGAINVSGYDERAMAVLGEPFSHFAGGGGFAGALQADDQPDGRWLRAVLRLGFTAEQFAEFVADDLYDLLLRGELEEDFGAEGFLADVGDEFVGYADVDVAIEKGFADFGEASVEVFFGELALAAEILEGALEFVCECFKHFCD